MQFDAAAKGIASHQWRLWMYLQNLPSADINWDGSSLFWLGHFWSLAVEEQFYLVWPLVVFALSRRGVVAVCLGLFLLANFVRLKGMWWTTDDAGWFWQWTTISRVDGLVIGAVLAILVRRKTKSSDLARYTRFCAMMSGLLFVWVVFIPRSWCPLAVTFVRQDVCVVFFGSILLLALQGNSRYFVPRLLRYHWLQWFGRYSYGLYVMHGVLRPTILQYMGPESFNRLLGTPFLGFPVYMSAVLSVCVLAAYISWHCCEKWFLMLKRHFEYQRLGSRVTHVCVSRA